MALQTLLAPNASPMTLDGTRTFVVGARQAAVIDPGPADPRHLQNIRAAVAGASRCVILLTHGHPDHSEGAAELAALLNAPIWMAPGALEPALPPRMVGRWLADREVVHTDAGTLRAVATPGHVPEHLAYFWTGDRAPAGGALFVGDLLMGVGDTTLIAPPEGDIAAFFQSLQRVEQLAPTVLYPTHGPPLHDVAAALRRFREHRRQRIDQVRAAIAATRSTDPDTLVRAVYGPTLDPRLHAAAAASVRCMADYLQARPAGSEPVA